MVKSGLFPKLKSFIQQLSLFDFSEPFSTPKISSPTRKSLDPLNLAFTELCTGKYSHIQVKVSPRLRESWRVTWTQRSPELLIAIPPILEFAPEVVKLSLLDWSILASRRKSKIKKTPRRDLQRLELIQPESLHNERFRLEKVIRDFLFNADSNSISKKQLQVIHQRNQKRLDRMVPQGRFHNLIESFNRVNAKYFEGNLKATVTWASRLGGRSTHTLAKNGVGENYHLITISQGYDHQTVTPEILDGVMYHECLHIAVPPTFNLGRRTVHGPDFKRREQFYAHFELWQQWHRYGLPKSLRTLRQIKR